MSAVLLHALEPYMFLPIFRALSGPLWHVILLFNWKSLADISLINLELLYMVILC